jgi:hypothetical protein
MDYKQAYLVEKEKRLALERLLKSLSEQMQNSASIIETAIVQLNRKVTDNDNG